MISLSKLNDGLTLLDSMCLTNNFIGDLTKIRYQQLCIIPLCPCGYLIRATQNLNNCFLSQAQALFNGVQLCYIREGEIRVLRPDLETQANI